MTQTMVSISQLHTTACLNVKGKLVPLVQGGDCERSGEAGGYQWLQQHDIRNSF
jgi:hypothetical protein